MISIECFNTGITKVKESFIKKWGSWLKMRVLIYPVVIIRHPKGNIFLDLGLGTNVAKELKQGSWLYKKLQPVESISPLINQIKWKPDPTRDFFLFTHVHWDHISGALDWPEIKIYLSYEDFVWAEKLKPLFSFATIGTQLNSIKERIKFLDWKTESYEGFPRSIDFFQDGNVILVSIPGHTPGSLGVFVKAYNKRFFFLGDAVLTVDHLGFPEERSFLAKKIFNYNQESSEEMFEKIKKLKRLYKNDLLLVTNHDPRSYKNLGFDFNLSFDF